MKCTYKNEYTEIADYLTGDLSDTRKLELEAHLLECDDCFEKVKILEKVTLLIQVEGEKAFQTRTASFFEKIKNFFENLGRIKFPKLAYVPLLIVLALGLGSLPYYTKDINNIYNLTMDNSALGGMRSSLIDSESTLQAQTFEQYLSLGQTHFVKKEYGKALDVFTDLQASLMDTTVADSAKKVQSCKIEFCLGVTKTMLWQNQPAGYVEWVKSKVKGQQVDKSLLREAHGHLVRALEISREVSKTSNTRQKNSKENRGQKVYNILLDERFVNSLLISIESKTDS